MKANSTNIEWHGFPIWDVLRNDQKEELDKGRLTLIIIIKVSRFYSASRHVFTPTFISYNFMDVPFYGSPPVSITQLWAFQRAALSLSASDSEIFGLGAFTS